MRKNPENFEIVGFNKKYQFKISKIIKNTVGIEKFVNFRNFRIFKMVNLLNSRISKIVNL